eukprot:3994854-Pyramimonas_sp.AAC.1
MWSFVHDEDAPGLRSRRRSSSDDDDDDDCCEIYVRRAHPLAALGPDVHFALRAPRVLASQRAERVPREVEVVEVQVVQVQPALLAHVVQDAVHLAQHLLLHLALSQRQHRLRWSIVFQMIKKTSIFQMIIIPDFESGEWRA